MSDTFDFDAFDFDAFDMSAPIPPPVPSAPPTSPLGSATLIDFFGVDLLFRDDLQITASSDYASIDGIEALRQAIRCRLLTSPGEYAAFPTYGCGLRQFVKKRATQSDRDALRQNIIEQLRQEERIQSVDDVQVTSTIRSGMTGVEVVVRATSLGRTNSLTFSTFAG